MATTHSLTHQSRQPYLSQSLIELHVPDFQAAFDFYKVLGFRLHWMEERYMVLKRDGQALCFYGGNEAIYEQAYFRDYPKNTKRGYGVEVILFIEGVDTFYGEVASLVKVVEPLRTRAWGKRDFRVEDPFGYYLRISEPYDVVDDAAKIWKTADVVRNKGFSL